MVEQCGYFTKQENFKVVEYSVLENYTRQGDKQYIYTRQGDKQYIYTRQGDKQYIYETGG